MLSFYKFRNLDYNTDKHYAHLLRYTAMRRGRRGKQTGRRRRVNWGRFVLFLLVLFALVGATVFLIHILSGEESPFQNLLPKATPRPTAPIVSLLPENQSPIPTPKPPLPSSLTPNPAAGTSKEDFGFETRLMINGEETDAFTREGDMRFGRDVDYTAIPGILTFGGNNYRNTFTHGVQTVANKRLEIIHEETLGSLKTAETSWTGTCWTGQPVIVEWPEETRRVLGVKDEFKSKQGFTEVIYAAADGYIYFLELSTGVRTREPLKLGVTTKGTASLDPRGYPLLYTGQGDTSRNAEGRSGAWFRIVDLIQNKVVWEFGRKDPFSLRDWQAYDSSALVHAGTDTLIAPGENGVFYTVKLNTSFDPAAGMVSVNPGALEKYRYMGEGYAQGADDPAKRWVGIENSVSVWRNYAYFTDNGGRLQCLDLNTFELQFVVDVTDDSDTSPVIEEAPEDNTFYLYTANEVDKQPGAASSGAGKSYHRKIDGLTGRIVREKEWDASYGSTSSNGGTLSTPHVGRNKLSDIVIYNQTLVPVTYTDESGAEKTSNGGRIITYDKNTFEVLSTYEQPGSYGGYWSSPVVIYDKSGEGYLLQCDRNGMLRMHNPRNLQEVYTELSLGSRVESTPAVFGDYLVVGTRGDYENNVLPKILIVKIS